MTRRRDRDDLATGAKVADAFLDLAGRGPAIARDCLDALRGGDGARVPDLKFVTGLMLKAGALYFANPYKALDHNLRFAAGQWELQRRAVRRAMGVDEAPMAVPAPDDRRFKDAAWDEAFLYDWVKQSYLVASRWVEDVVADMDGLDGHARRQVGFYARQITDALAPTNFVATNPKALGEPLDRRGDNLLDGFKRLLDDLERGKGRLKVSMTRDDAFELGGNLATTPGKVVFRNRLMELIQYAPSTDAVFRRPLLVVPPWINKFYIMDLKPKNSLIRWMVDQGHTVFVISWVNPDEALTDVAFDDYLTDGVLAAMDAIEAATGERAVNMVGYCIGGTLTACALSWLAARGDERAKSATFFTTMVDFADPGELEVFIDEKQLELLDKQMEKRGFLDGRNMMTVFTMMRANDLLWSFAVGNYLMGREPPPFDILYWNADSTRMPAMMHSFYVRKMYLENKLIEPGGITLAGEPMDLTRIKVPAYMVAAEDDHIAPWKSTYAATRHYSGPRKFVLAGSGHIAGIINPPSSNKYGYKTYARYPHDPDAWLEKAKAFEGSWWPDWAKWIKPKGGGQVPARRPGAGGLKVLGDAPGEYVKTRLE